MGRELRPQCKLCRREGIKLYLKGARCQTSKCAIVKRNYVPGIHGPRLAAGRSRLSDYGQQLREKQKAKKSYNLMEKQFRNYFDSASSQEGDTGQNFLQILEMRLDNVVYKSGLAESARQARQMVGHGHVMVNGKKVTIPSYQLRVNDVVTIHDKSAQSKLFESVAERMKNREIPGWLFYDAKDLSVKVTEVPQINNFVLDFDMKSIIEFYSR